MRECEKGCQKAVATVNIKTSIFNLQYLNHFCMDFYATDMGRSAEEYLSNDILYIFVSYTLSEILLKNRKLFTLITHCREAPLYTKKIYTAPYIPLYGSNVARWIINFMYLSGS